MDAMLPFGNQLTQLHEKAQKSLSDLPLASTSEKTCNVYYLQWPTTPLLTMIHPQTVSANSDLPVKVSKKVNG